MIALESSDRGDPALLLPTTLIESATSKPNVWRLKCFRWELPLLLVMVASGVTALWMTIHRGEGYAVRCFRAADLYQLADAPRVSGFSFDPSGLLTIEIANLDESGWKRLDAGEPTRTIEGKHPVVMLPPGIGETVLLGEKTGRRLEIRSQWAPGQSEPLVSLGAIRVGQPSPYSIRNFVIPVESQPAAQVEQARKLLASLELEGGSPTNQRVAAMAAFLHAQLEPHRGVPARYMNRLNGFEQYQEAMAGRAQVYCANHSEIFAFMAVAMGIPTRVVDVVGKIDGVAVGAHTFNEAYDEAEGRWFYVDLQLHLAGIRDENGSFLNGAQLLTRIRGGTTEGLTARTIRGDEIVEEPYAELATLIETFLTPTASLAFLSSSPDRFAPIERLRRLLTRPLPGICEGNVPDRISDRLVASWLLIGCLAVWLALRIRHLSGLCRCRA